MSGPLVCLIIAGKESNPVIPRTYSNRIHWSPLASTIVDDTHTTVGWLYHDVRTDSLEIQAGQHLYCLRIRSEVDGSASRPASPVIAQREDENGSSVPTQEYHMDGKSFGYP